MPLTSKKLPNFTNRTSTLRQRRHQSRRRRLRAELLEDRRLLAANVAKVADTSYTHDWFHAPFNIPFPNRAVVQLQSVWESSLPGIAGPVISLDGDDHFSTCSGALIDANHILTAAHCVYDFEDGKGWVDWAWAHPARNGEYERPFGEVAVTRMKVAPEWPTTGAEDHDFAILTLDRNIGNFTGSFGYGYMPDEDLRDRNLTMLHYPAETTAPDGDTFTGVEQYVSSGPVNSPNSVYPKGTFNFKLNEVWSTGGSSGSPVFVENASIDGQPFQDTIVGVNASVTTCDDAQYACEGNNDDPQRRRFPYDFAWGSRLGYEFGFAAKIQSSEFDLIQDHSGSYYDHTTEDRPVLANAHKWLNVSPDAPGPTGLSSSRQEDWDDRVGDYKIGTATNDELFTVRVPVWNGGTATARDVRVDFYLARDIGNRIDFDRSTLLGSSLISSIGAFRQVDATLPAKIPDSFDYSPSFQYAVYSVIDPYDTIRENPTPLNDLDSRTRNRHYGRQKVFITRTAPSIDANGPYYVASGDSVRLGGSLRSYAGDGSRLSYDWDLDGDASFGESGGAATRGNETGLTPTYVTGEGLNGSQQSVTLRAQTPFGRGAEDQATVVIDNGLGFESVNSGLPVLADGDFAIADFDKDGDADIAISGLDSSGNVVNELYANEGGQFLPIAPEIVDAVTAESTWVDFDNDGDLDLFQVGDSGAFSALYRNDNGAFSAMSDGLPALSSGAVAWSDMDLDGDFDIVLSGFDAAGNRVASLFENRAGAFVEVHAGDFLPVSDGSLAWGDYDRDGRPDLLLTGLSDDGVATRVYQNTRDGFEELAFGLPGVSSGQATWEDVDADGYLDIAIAGSTLSGSTAGIYRNVGGSGFALQSAFPGVSQASIDWGDFDNDGDQDVVVQGIGADGSVTTELFQNRQGLFSAFGGGLVGHRHGDVVFADLDSDGRLDVLASGRNSSNRAATSTYRNLYSTTNNAPQVSDLESSFGDDGVLELSWSGADQESVSSGLKYNLRVGTTPGGSEVMAFGPTRSGNLGSASSARLEGVPAGQTYYWSVQAIDPGGQTETSAESAHGSFFSASAEDSILGVADGDAAWGDFDGDGLLDLITIGHTEVGPSTRLYRNTESGFDLVTTAMVDVSGGAVDWGDFDRDGRLDLLVTGESDAGPHTAIYRNAAGGFVLHTMVDEVAGDAAWVDFDNDGDLDVSVAGTHADGTSRFSIYENTPTGFRGFDTGISGFHRPAMEWSDFDADGWIDLAIGGIAVEGPSTRIYRNAGGRLVEHQTLSGQRGGGMAATSLSWADFDHDGDEDLLLLAPFDPSDPAARVYRNDGGVFSVAMQLENLSDGDVQWADYDTDGDVDVVVTGRARNGGKRLQPYTAVYRNVGPGGPFLKTATDLPSLSNGTIRWADYDRDGDLDAFAMGLTAELDPVADVHQSLASIGNTSPVPPAGLRASPRSASSAELRWDAAGDAETPAAGLTYSVRLGTTPGAADLFLPPMDDAGVRRTLAGPGAVGSERGLTVQGLTWGQTYYWSVQTIDGVFDASEMAAEQSFVMNNAPVDPRTLTHSVGENNTAGDPIGTLQAEDFDLVAGDELAFSLVPGDGDGDNAAFQIVGNQLIARQSFDYEQQHSYRYRVRVEDRLGAAVEASLHLAVLDRNDAPTAITLSQMPVPENLPGAVVGSLSTSDEDVDQRHDYTITSDPSGLFEVQGETLRVANGKILDFESASQHAVTVTSTDNGSGRLGISRAFIIDVIDADESGLEVAFDINTMTVSSQPRYLTRLDDMLYFVARVDHEPDSGAPWEFEDRLWRYDPATGESTPIDGIEFPAYLVAAEGRLWMRGQANGMVGLIEYDPQSETLSRHSYAPSTRPFVVDGTLFYDSYTETGRNLVRFDTSDESSHIATRPLEARALTLVPFDGKLYSVVTLVDQVSLMRYDAVSDTFVLVDDDAAFGAGTQVKILGVTPDHLDLLATSSSGKIVWRLSAEATDENPDGSGRLVQLADFSDLQIVGDAAAFAGDLYFYAESSHGTGLHRYDPVDAQTQVYLIGAATRQLLEPISHAGRLGFVVDLEDGGHQLGFFDPVADAFSIIEPAALWRVHASRPVSLGGELFFAAIDHPGESQYGMELWKLDADGHLVLADDVNERTLSGAAEDVIAVGRDLYVIGGVGRFDAYVPRKLWRVDPTSGEGHVVAEISDMEHQVAADGKLYFRGTHDGASGLVEYDPDTDVVTVFPVVIESGIVSDGSHLYFAGRDDAGEQSIAAFGFSTRNVEYVPARPMGVDHGAIGNLVMHDGGLHYLYHGFDTVQLVRLNTETRQVHVRHDMESQAGFDLQPNSLTKAADGSWYFGSRRGLWHVDVDSGVFTLAYDECGVDNLSSIGGRIYFSLNGFKDSVQVVGDIYEFDPENNAARFIPGTERALGFRHVHNGRGYFETESETYGRELGEYDPDKGFATLHEITPGRDSSSPSSFTSLDGNLHFTAYGDQVGREVFMWRTSPVAEDDAVVTLEDQPIEVSILANDSDPNEDPLTVSTLSDPLHGEVVVLDAGHARYTPDADFVGTDSFTYTITDGNGNSATATVHLAVLPVNDSPHVVAADPPAVPEDSGTHTLPEWASAVVGPSDEGGQSLLEYTVSAVSNPDLFVQAPYVAVDGTLSYTVAPNANGTSTFALTARDDGGVADGGIDVSAPRSFTIAVSAVNDVPTVSGPETLRVHAGIATNISGIAVADEDVSESPDTTVQVTLSADDGTLSLQHVADIRFVEGSNGMASFSFEGTIQAVNESLASLTYQSPSNVYDEDQLTVSVTDLGKTGSGGAQNAQAIVSVTRVPRVSIPAGETLTEVLRDGDDLVVRKDTTTEYFRAALDALSGIVVVGADNSESISINVDGLTSEVLSDGLLVYGGEGDDDDDELVLKGSVTVTNHQYTTGGPESGTIELDGLTVQFAEFEPIRDYLTSRNRIFRVGTEPGQTILVEDDADNANGRSTIHAGAEGGFESIEFYHPHELLEVTGTASNDRVVLGQLEQSFTSLVVLKGEAGGDDIDASQFTGVVHLEGGSGPDRLTGGRGSNVLRGGEADDVIIDGGGINLVSGGGGVNTFVAGDGRNTFESDEDVPLQVFADHYRTDEDMELAVDAASGVLWNDSIASPAETTTLEVVIQPANGRLQLRSDGSFDYRPDQDFFGVDSFTYRIVAGDQVSAEAGVTLEVDAVNDAPRATVDFLSTDEDVAILVDLAELARNDFDVEGELLTVTSTGNPTHGILETRADGTLWYLPPPNFYGTDRLIYIVRDSAGGSTEGNVEIQVRSRRDAPVAISDETETDEDSTVTVDPIANDSDPDPYDVLRLVPDSVQIISMQREGDGSDFAAPSTRVAESGNEVMFTPGADFNALAKGEVVVVELAYQVRDDGEGSLSDEGTMLVRVIGSNDDPTLDAVQAERILTEDDGDVLAASGTMAFADADLADEHQVRVAFAGSDHANQRGTLTASVATVPDASGNNGRMTWDYQVDNAAVQFLSEAETLAERYTVTLDDRNGGVVSQLVTVTITGINDAPRLSLAEPSLAVTEGETATNEGTFTDIDASDIVELEASIGEVQYLGGPSGEWHWSFHGADDMEGVVTISATDSYGATDEVGFTLAVENVAPTLIVEPMSGPGRVDQLAAVDQKVTLSGTFTDPGSLDAHTVVIDWGEVADGADNAIEDRATLEIAAGASQHFSLNHQYARGGIYSVTVTVLDDDGATGSESSTQVWVSGVRLDANTHELQIVGTEAHDDVSLKLNANGEQLEVDAKLAHSAAGQGNAESVRTHFAFAEIDRIVAVLFDGVDHFDGSWSNEAEQDAGFEVRQIVIGGAGDDHLIGSDSRDVLIGGTGRDKIYASDGNDILIGGFLETNLNRDMFEFLDSALVQWAGGEPPSVEEIEPLLRPIRDDGDKDDLNGQEGDDLLFGHQEEVKEPNQVLFSPFASPDEPPEDGGQWESVMIGWQNPDLTESEQAYYADHPNAATRIRSRDVNADGMITPLDALQVINVLNRQRSTEVDVQQLIESRSAFYDVDGSSTVTPIDALLVINWFSRQRQAGAEREAVAPRYEASQPIATDTNPVVAGPEPLPSYRKVVGEASTERWAPRSIPPAETDARKRPKGDQSPRWHTLAVDAIFNDLGTGFIDRSE